MAATVPRHRRKRLVTVTDHVDAPTGFGTQHRLVAEALARSKHWDVWSWGLWDEGKVREDPSGFTAYPLGGAGVKQMQKKWSGLVREFAPVQVIGLGDLWMFEHVATARDKSYRWCHWYPIDAMPYPVAKHPAITQIDDLVYMSQFGRSVFHEHVEGRVREHYIPHGIDTSTFVPAPAKLKRAMRKEWGKRLGCDFAGCKILFCPDTNQWRKNTPALLGMLKLLPKEYVLVLHCAPEARKGSHGWHLPLLAQTVFGVADRVVYTGRGQARPPLSREELASLYQASDLRVSATTGEGFGICSIESMACGVPTVITDYTTSAELVGDCGIVVEATDLYMQWGAEFFRALVHIGKMAAAVKKLMTDRKLYNRLRKRGIEKANDLYSIEVVGKQWVDLMLQVVGD